MPPRCVTGSGKPPRHVSQIQHRPDGGVIHVEGGDTRKEAIQFSSRSDLLERCRSLAERRVAFSVGGHAPGPADEMMIWHDDGSLRIPFLQIAWTQTEQWVIHEIIPGGRPPWHCVELSEILAT